MKARCCNPGASNYERYGARGVLICEDWRFSFGTFFADMGTRPFRCSLDRIDPARGYTPDNCRWSDSKQQAQNKRPKQARAAVRRPEPSPSFLESPPF
jgi:hypothetical protein